MNSRIATKRMESTLNTDEDNSDGNPYGDSLRGCTSDENDCTDINDGASSAEQEGLAWDGCFEGPHSHSSMSCMTSGGESPSEVNTTYTSLSSSNVSPLTSSCVSPAPLEEKMLSFLHTTNNSEDLEPSQQVTPPIKPNARQRKTHGRAKCPLGTNSHTTKSTPQQE